VLEPGDWDDRVTLEGRALGAPGHGWAWVYNPLAVRETIAWVRDRGAVSVPLDVRAMVELATHADHLEARARVYGERWVALWQRVYGHAIADTQQALAGLIDRGAGYDRALINERIPTRLGDGTVDVEVEGTLLSPFTGVAIDALPIRANWLRDAEPGSTATVSGVDATGRTLIDVGGVTLTYSVEGLHRSSTTPAHCRLRRTSARTEAQVAPHEFPSTHDRTRDPPALRGAARLVGGALSGWPY
jgi:hypothetical protein